MITTFERTTQTVRKKNEVAEYRKSDFGTAINELSLGFPQALLVCWMPSNPDPAQDHAQGSVNRGSSTRSNFWRSAAELIVGRNTLAPGRPVSQ